MHLFRDPQEGVSHQNRKRGYRLSGGWLPEHRGIRLLYCLHPGADIGLAPSFALATYGAAWASRTA